jgi:signal transduction histidine kinase
MKTNDNCLLIEIENTLGVTPVQEGDSFITRKKKPERHGVGLGSMKDCVNRMNGSMSIDYDEEAFTIRVLLPLK